MATETRFFEPHERPVLKELPNVLQRGAPRIWESRLRELIGSHDWVGMATGAKPAMQAMKSNFKHGRMSLPENHVFECEVAWTEDQRDNEATLFFRWVREETEQDRQEAARIKLEQKLAQLERQNAQDGAAGDLDDGAEGLANDPAPDLPPGPVYDPPAPDRVEEEVTDHLVEPNPPFAAPTPDELAAIAARTIPVEDDFLSGLDDL
jgi:hypothetical protein